MICEICGSTLNYLEFSSDLSFSSDGKTISRVLEHNYCTSCGVILVAENSRLDKVQFYGEEYNYISPNDLNIESDTIPANLEFFLYFLKNHPVKERKNILDIGAGRGTLLNVIHREFPECNYFAVEPGQSYKYILDFVYSKHNSFFENSEYINMKFDVIISTGVLHHTYSVVKFLELVRNCLDNKGIFLVELPNFRYNKSDILISDHIWKFTDKVFESLIGYAGYEIICKNVENVVPMRFILSKGNKQILKEIKVDSQIESSVKYVRGTVEMCKRYKLKNERFFVYGQGIIYHYLCSLNLIDSNNVVAFIDDNKCYIGGTISGKPVISIDDIGKYSCKKVFLSMNDCYHDNVIRRLPGYEIFR
ncbi:MAG: class I SAM-dependent methyltransferase [Nitrospirota bacterium]